MQIQFDKQYPVYAFDTACFYTDEETALDVKLQSLRATINNTPKEDISPEEKKAITEDIGKTKEALKDMIDHNLSMVRTVREDSIKMCNVVQVFESSLVRCLNMQPDVINDAMIIVKVYYFGVAESIIKNGFTMNGNHYVFFSASAGQIRTKKFVAIREDLLKECFNTLSCGLSIESINSSGGVNINKYLAYLALSNSATEVWERFNIDRCIVIDDFETVVKGVVDYIEEKDYSITRKECDVPITHTDGCGMVLPSVYTKNFMIRAPWIKGLLSPFAFDRFCREANEKDPDIRSGKKKKCGIIKDIYGDEHDIFAENIQIIFTKSQFKMWKYYKNWNDYKEKFKKYNCKAGRCNIEPGVINKATINYQMLQTLTTMTEEEIEQMCSHTNKVLNRICTDKTTMLRSFGITHTRRDLSYTQKCLSLYPEMLQDDHFKEELREKKRSIECDARSGKLMIDGKYQFLIPDLYAACQFWFQGIETPCGLLSGTDVATRIYPDKEKLDVLRSPHLYKEHAVRRNVFNTSPEFSKWFDTNGIYTSSHDLISKILQ